ncbi:MAG: dihydrodipicolinate synthase family protein [Kiritimatiellae bacterium]|nr:dihydrodipicolinate synthase family protein [Kiritimatiellia bacterium]MDD5520774.1 dihydrodipicolinate synthase family protein [Kiritimatiellia bacterium]
MNNYRTNSLSKPLHGIVPPMITPLTGRDVLDVAGLERLIEHILKGGVNGLFILGTTGEAPSLSYRLRLELIERTCRQVKGRVPVLVGVTDTAFVESVNMARHASDCGAYAAVLAPPYYFPSGQPELAEYIEHLMAEMPLPVFLYNMPMMTKMTIEPETIRRLASQPRIIGVKDSSGDISYFKTILEVAKKRPDWSVLVGPEELLSESVRLGGFGGVNGGANVNPKLFVDLYEAASRGDNVRINELQKRVIDFGRIYHVGHHASSIIKGLKCSLSLLGICDDFMAEPFHRFFEPERVQIQKLLGEIGVL